MTGSEPLADSIWIGLDGLFIQGKPLANGYYTRHPVPVIASFHFGVVFNKVQLYSIAASILSY